VDENEFAEELVDEEHRMRMKAEKHKKRLSGHDNDALEMGSPPSYEVVQRKSSQKKAAVEWDTQTAF